MSDRISELIYLILIIGIAVTMVVGAVLVAFTEISGCG